MRQAGHQGAQQLALARPGGADHQAVRAHAAQRRLLQVQVQRLSGQGQAHRHLERGGARGPAGFRVNRPTSSMPSSPGKSTVSIGASAGASSTTAAVGRAGRWR